MKGWTLEMRQALQAYLRQGYSMTNILDEFKKLGGDYSKMNFDRISKEVKLGLTDSEIKERRYVRYDIARAYEKLIGEDAVTYLKNHEVDEDE